VGERSMGAPLSDHITAAELKAWIPGATDPYWRNGKLYALPSTAWLQGVLINVGHGAAVGMADKLPKVGGTWALADYMEMARRVKAQGLGYALALYATLPSGDYWTQGLVTGFGAELWRDGKVAIDSPEGERAVQWLVSMLEYAPPGAAGLDYKRATHRVQEWEATGIGRGAHRVDE